MENKDVFAAALPKYSGFATLLLFFKNLRTPSMSLLLALARVALSLCVTVSIVAGVKIHAQIFDDIVIIKSTR